MSIKFISCLGENSNKSDSLPIGVECLYLYLLIIIIAIATPDDIITTIIPSEIIIFLCEEKKGGEFGGVGGGDGGGVGGGVGDDDGEGCGAGGGVVVAGDGFGVSEGGRAEVLKIIVKSAIIKTRKTCLPRILKFIMMFLYMIYI